MTNGRMFFDVAVIGGGPAGAATALLLARAGRRVLVLERSPICIPGQENFRGGEALPPQANPLLRRLGLEEMVHAGPHLPCHGTRGSWGGAELVDTDFLFSPHGHGWHLDRGVFDHDLLRTAEDAGVAVECPAVLAEVERCPGGWRLAWGCRGKKQKAAVARFMIDASGLSRVLLRRLQVPVRRYDHLVAFVATLEGEPSEPADARSVVEAVRDGWWYRGLLPGGRQIVAAFTDARSEAASHLRSADQFSQKLGATHFVGPQAPGSGRTRAGRHSRLEDGRHKGPPLPEKLGATQFVGAPIVRSAASARAAAAVGEGWLAVGDAAGSFDPLSSQGMLSALAAAEQAAVAVEGALMGEVAALQGYQSFLHRTYAEYLEHRRRFYRVETRWPGEPFWARRHRLPALAA